MKIILFISLSFIFTIASCWKARSLECWQCAAIPDSSTKCPKDATLYRMSTWDACMTWTLKWGNKVVLQNFVRSDIDCTKSRLKFWSQYIEQVWKEPGKARCCYEDRCNDGLIEDDDDDDGYVSPHIQIPTHRPETSSLESTTAALDFIVQQSSDEGLSTPPTFAALEAEVEGEVSLNECRKCLTIQNAICESDDAINRVDFSRVKSIVGPKISSDPTCRCRTGFIPIYERNEEGIRSLFNCHDPIIVTSTVGGRCLIPEHCEKLENTVCRDDPRIPNYMSCQCRVGFVQMSVSNDSLAMICEPAKPSDANPDGCTSTGECSEIMHSHCNRVTEKCECQNGFIPSYDPDFKVIECQDPIVLTSTVHGYCLVDEHCRNLEGTYCTTTSGQAVLKRCECINGYKPGQPNFLSGIVDKCVKEGSASPQDVLSVIAQGIVGDGFFQPEQMNTGGQTSLKFPVNASGAEYCSRQTTVVESNEWIPSENFHMSYDNITDAWTSVVFAKIPSSALPTHGILVRLMSSIPDLQDKLMYTITLYKNRQITILKSFLDSSSEQREIVQIVQLSDSFKWLSHLSYTGFWIIYKQGYLALGVVNENTVDEPLLSWTDPHKPYEISQIGLSSVGAAVLYGLDCGIQPEMFYPEGTCRLLDDDCESIANTRCVKPIKDGGDVSRNSTSTIQFPTCQCREGFEPIPEPLRALERGCYDPIRSTLTVNSRCISQRHCQNLQNTECRSSLFDDNIKTCRCIKGTVPLSPDSDSGLILGCEESSKAELLSVSSCKTRFSLKERKDWIPQTIVKMPFSSRRNSYSMAFYVRLDPSLYSPGVLKNVQTPTVVNVKLLDANKSADKIYKVSLSNSGNVSIYENIRGATFLFGNFHREGLQVSNEVLATNEISSQEFAGYWIRYQNVGVSAGTISIGRIGSEAPLQSHRDISNTALTDTPFIGFEVESGSTMEFGVQCYED